MKETTNRVAILGGSGRTGRPLTEAALTRGLAVRALARQPATFPVAGNGLELVTGDARDGSAILALLEGCDRVVVTLGTRRGEEPPFEAAMRALTGAMRARKVRRCVILVGIGVRAPADQGRPRGGAAAAFMRLLWRKAMEDKQRGADLVMASDLDWTVVRSPLIEEGPSLGPVAADLQAVPGRTVRAADLACFLLETATGGDYVRAAPFVATPRAKNHR